MEKTHPADLKYTKDHEWCRVEGDTATVGITWHAQDALGDIVFCELPELGSEVTAGEAFGVVESVKAVSDLFSPLSGTVEAQNEAVIDAPETLNEDMYEGGWLVKIKLSNPAEVEALLDLPAYEALIEAED